MVDNTQTRNPYLIPGSIVFAGLIIAFAVIQSNGASVVPVEGTPAVSSTSDTQEIQEQVLPVTETDHVLGSRDADVFLIEYSDYRCGYCGLFHTTVKTILEEYDGKVAWVYRHTPYQPGGKEAAVASECVAEQLGEDAFWEFSDRAFADQRSLNTEWHINTAAEMGADKTAFEACLSSGKYDSLIASHTANAQGLGGQGTPYSVLLTKNGDIVKFSGAQSVDNVRIFVERALRTLE